MKRIMMTCLLLGSMIMAANAQGKQALGVQIGYTQPIMRMNMPVQDQEKNLTPFTYNGIKLGLVYDATLIKGFGYSLGLNYTYGANQTEWKDINKVSTAQSRIKRHYHQLELVVDWQYKLEIAKQTWFILYTGPSIQCGLSLQENNYHRSGPNQPAELNENDVKNLYVDNTIDGVDNTSLNRFNVTWGLGAGLQYNRYFVRGGYDFGLLNPYKAKVFDVNEHYRPYTRGRFDQWQIKIGMYLFNW